MWVTDRVGTTFPSAPYGAKVSSLVPVVALEVVVLLDVELLVGGAFGTTSWDVVVVVLPAVGFEPPPHDARTPAARRSPARSGAVRLTRYVGAGIVRCWHTAGPTSRHVAPVARGFGCSPGAMVFRRYTHTYTHILPTYVYLYVHHHDQVSTGLLEPADLAQPSLDPSSKVPCKVPCKVRGKANPASCVRPPRRGPDESEEPHGEHDHDHR